MKAEVHSMPRGSARRWPAWFKGRRRWWVIALLIVVAAIAFGWPWLAPLGALPLLVSILPCLSMCALGLCMHRMNGSSCQKTGAQAQMPREEL